MGTGAGSVSSHKSKCYAYLCRPSSFLFFFGCVHGFCRDTAIAIRTVVVKAGRANLQEGAGVVADSVPTSEWEETLSEVRAMTRAIALCSGR